ncbi:hypothetical protein BJV82DRAFT_638381 [Fennellomyces sp. T-0311]|nr:hypothetical protein BJV82DRAFT_638381 [Fennellomyces sp. T-0311]
MPRKTSGPKLFRCTGHGDCDMVFTRSEHLARHERKHTGEKPFKCIVPGCERMFSRFDNMMQHTHTHERQQQRRRSMVSTRSLPQPSTTQTLQQEQRQELTPPPFDYCNEQDLTLEPNWHQGDWRPKRRLSLIDLQTPIDDWVKAKPAVEQDAVVDVTPDEYEAIQGFGQFHAQSVVKPESPVMGMQVNFFRQHNLPVPESYQRPTRSHAI